MDFFEPGRHLLIVAPALSLASDFHDDLAEPKPEHHQHEDACDQ